AQPSAGRTQVVGQIGDFFAACMDEDAVEKAGDAPVKPALDEIAAMRSVADLPAVLAHEQLTLPGQFLFEFSSSPDFANSTMVIAFANAGGLGLPDRDYYVKTDPKSVETRQKYLAHVARMFTLAGDAADVADRNARTVMDIETGLAKASLTRVELRDPWKLFHRESVAQLQAATPAFDWGVYFRAARVGEPATVNITEPAFYAEVERQLKTRDIADWKTYLRWHVIHAEAPYLSRAFVNENFSFYSKYLRGVDQLAPRWKRCVRLVDRDLGEALGRVYVDRTFSPEAKERARIMTTQIETAMGEEIRNLPWMGPDTKRHALDKLHAVVNKIGYPDKWRDYSSVIVKRNDFLGNVMRATEFENRRELNKIGHPVDRAEWEMTPPTVNAYYDPQKNDINFPAGVLQPPLFDLRLDDAPNYGDTGATIGHELTHGFDDEGRQFDAHGNLKDWWTKKDAAEFEKRINCVRRQYANYIVVDDIHLNSKLTSGEDVADLGGTLLAWLAWKAQTKGQDLKPIGGFTPPQRFFIGMAQWACGDERPENKRVNAITNPHSPPEDRINGVVANLPEFAAAFSCHAGQPMVRAEACRVW
ncbi:MAG TPA: M13 family metallopeptidase, partial [Bryobacteraceae bacterium]|nr:M13 family metallopeptidase [Bryobacteraceae bacterium]